MANFPGRGFTGRPVTGRIVANMLLGLPQPVHLAPFSLRRSKGISQSKNSYSHIRSDSRSLR
jgi:hypothetical protein